MLKVIELITKLVRAENIVDNLDLLPNFHLPRNDKLLRISELNPARILSNRRIKRVKLDGRSMQL